MTEKDLPQLGDDGAPSMTTLIYIGGTLSLLIILSTFLAWLDHREGFQDAGAFAELLAALFSGLSAVWVIIAVLMQKTELKLQRHELALQRAESTRLANEAANQVAALNTQSRMINKEHISAEVLALFNTSLSDMKAIEKFVYDRIVEESRKKGAVSQGSDSKFEVTEDYVIASFNTIQSSHLVKYKYKWKTIAGWFAYDPKLRVLSSLAKEADDLGLREWFIYQLPHICDLKTEESYQIIIACIYLSAQYPHLNW